MYTSVIAENTKRIISEKGIKHKAIAARIGMSEKQFSDLLNSRKIIRDTDIEALSLALNVTPNELFFRSGA